MPTDGLLEDARAQLPDLVDLRRRLHRHPETGLANPRTQEAVLSALDGLGLTGVRLGTRTTSVVAVLEGGRPGRDVLLRADTDALPMPEDTGLEYASEVPGVMHACGHDAHVAMLVGAARLLAQRRDRLAGRVVLMFQPGEEGYGGARVMLEEGLLDGLDPAAAFAIHQTPNVPSGWVATKPGALMASADVLHVTVTGRGGHASRPHDGLDPVVVACEIVTALQTFVTRQVDVFDPAVVTVGRVTAGTTNNVIPETAHLEGTIRAVSEHTREVVHAGVRRLAEGIAAAHGATAEVRIDAGYPVTVNTAFAEQALRVAGELVGPDVAVPMPYPIMGAEDFSYVLQRVPGAMVFLGTQPEGATQPVPGNHSNRMVIDESAMAVGAALHAAVALDVLSEGAA